MSFDQLNQIESYNELITQLKEDQPVSQRETLISERNLVEAMLNTQVVQKITEIGENGDADFIRDLEFEPDQI